MLALVLVGCASTPSPSPTVVLSPTIKPAPATPVPSSLAPSPSPSALSDAGAVEQAGTFRDGGLWATRGTTLLISTDGGKTWIHGSLPASTGFSVVDVLDRLHAWTVTLGPGSTGMTGSSTDVTRYVVSRTVDGGRTWQPSAIASNYADTSASIAFVDATHGYLLAAADRNSFGTSTVLRTADGGATWSVAGSQPWLGTFLTVSDAATVWVGGEEQAGGQFLQPLLAGSRDGGRIWSHVQLPDINGVTETQCRCYLAEPPLFLDAAEGFVTVVSSGADGTFETRIEHTTDGGRTWAVAAHRPGIAGVGLAILDPSHWLLAGSGIQATADAGATWTTPATGGWAESSIEWVGAVDAREAAMLVPLAGSDLYRNTSALLLSVDGGVTWVEADLSASATTLMFDALHTSRCPGSRGSGGRRAARRSSWRRADRPTRTDRTW